MVGGGRWLLLLLWFWCIGVHGEPVALRHACGSAELPAPASAQWQSGPSGIVPVSRASLPCWVEVALPGPQAAARGEVLSFSELHIQRIVLTAFDGAGQRVAWAPRHGAADHAVVTGPRALLQPALAPGSLLFVKLEPVPGTRDVPGLQRHVTVETVEMAQTLRNDQRFDVVNTATATALLVAALFALCFALLLRNTDYLVFAAYAAAQALLVAAKSGLPFLAQQVPVWVYEISSGQFVVSALSALLYLRLGRFALHSPALAWAARAVAVGFVLTAVSGPLGLEIETSLIGLLLPLHFSVALWGNWRGWRRGEHVCGVMLAVLLPIVAYWGAFFAYLALLREPMPLDLAVGSPIDLLRTLLLPAACIYALARHTLQAQRASDRALREDRLTGLLNREGLREQMSLQVRRGERPVLVLLDIERFGSINQALGAEFGDRLLVGTAERLRGLAQGLGGALVARLHADQFGVLVPASRQAAVLRRDVEDFFRHPVPVEGQPVDVALRAGLAVHRPGQPEFEVFRDAEIALNRARRSRQHWVEFDDGLDRRPGADLLLLSDLQRAVEHDEFQLHLQPKVRVSDGRLVGAEALLRWNHPVRGQVLPGGFIPFAEQTGRIGVITRWVLAHVLPLLAEWRRRGEPLAVSVNLSAVDLADPKLPAELAAMLGRTGADPRDLVLEVTETAAFDDIEEALQRLHELAALGVGLSIDDFGAGQSGLSYLQRMPVSELKIDRAFVHGVHDNPAGIVLLESIVAMGRRLGLSLLAEGVETPEDWQVLRRVGCDDAQGWLVARPMPVDVFLDWARARPGFQRPEAQGEHG
jgi:diguanylate cyclase (GGDEF)-like protein